MERQLRPKHPAVAVVRAVPPRLDPADPRSRRATGRSRCWTWVAGPGVFASKVRAALPRVEVCGVDLVSEMLRKGQPRWRLHPGHVFPVQGDSERLPFGSGSFDIVTCANSFHHYPASGSRRRRDEARAAAGRAVDDHRRIPRRPLGLVHL